MRHHAILVTSWSDAQIEKAHSVAKAKFRHVSEITPPATNFYRSFFVAPDGSKEGWEESNNNDIARQNFVNWLDRQRYEDRSTSLDWVEIQYGDDEGQTRIINDSDRLYRDALDEENAIYAKASGEQD